MTNDEIVTKMQERMAELDVWYDNALKKYKTFALNRYKCEIIDFVFFDYEDICITGIDKNLIMNYYQDLLKSRFDVIYKEICYLESLGIQSNRQKIQYNM